MGLTRKQWLMLSVLVFGSFLTILNQTLVAPAQPSIMADMDVDATTVQWLQTGFTLVNAIMIPITAYLQDRFSTRKLFITSMLLFACGSALAATGLNFPMLLAGRLVQAAGAGILMPMTMTVLMLTFPIDKRGSAMGVFGLVIAFAPAVGPTIAGIIIDTADWHIMFLAVTVISIAITVLSVFLMEAHPPKGKGDSALDPLSLALSTLGFGFLLFGFSTVSTPTYLAVSVGSIVLGCVGVVWFFFRQLHLETPMLRVSVLFNRRFLIGTIIGMLVQGALLSLPVLMPIYVQSLMGYSATISGLLLMPGAILMGIMNPVAGRLFDKLGPRKLAIPGMLLLTVSTFCYAFVGLDTSLVVIAIINAVRMFSMALVNMPITTWGMNALDNKLMNHGTSVNNTLRQVAGSLMTAIIISVYAFTEQLDWPSVGWPQSAMEGINFSFFICGILMLIGLVMTIALVKDKRPARSGAAVKAQATEGTVEQPANLLRSIMKTDVFALAPTATVQDAMELFIGKGISAAPIVNDQGEPVGFISVGDILKRLSRQSEQFIDPLVLIANSVRDDSAYDERLEQIMQKTVSEIGVPRSIGVDISSDIADVCRVLAQNHLKKVPVLEDDRIVGIINRSDITRYSMEAYLEGRPEDATYCDEGADATGQDAACACPAK